MADLKPRPLPSAPVREKRAEALERLLNFACRLLPEPEQAGVNEADVRDLLAEARFWLHDEPNGAKVTPSSPELRLGHDDLRALIMARAPQGMPPQAPANGAPPKK